MKTAALFIFVLLIVSVVSRPFRSEGENIFVVTAVLLMEVRVSHIRYSIYNGTDNFMHVTPFL